MKINVHRFIFISFFFFVTVNTYGQTFTQTFVDRCTGNVQVVTANFVNGSATVAFYNKIKTFTYQQFVNGELQSWLNETYSWWENLSPCSTATSQAQQAQQTAQNATNAATTATNAATSATQNTTTNVTNNTSTSNTNSTQSTNNTTNNTNNTNQDSTGNNSSGSSQSNDSSGSGGSQDSNEGSSGSSDSSESSSGGGDSSKETDSNESSGNGESSDEGGNGEDNNKDSGDGSDGEEDKGGESDSESEEKSEDESVEEEKEESSEDENEGGDDEEKKEMLPIQLRADMMSNQSLLGMYDLVTSINASRSSIYGDETYSLTGMVWSNLKQFSLSGVYSKVNLKTINVSEIIHENHSHFSKTKEVTSNDPIVRPQIKVSNVTSLSAGYMNNFGSGTFVITYNKLKPMEKWGTAGVGLMMTHSFYENKYQIMTLGYNILYTNLIQITDRIQYSPALIWTQTPYMGKPLQNWPNMNSFVFGIDGGNQLIGQRVHGMGIVSNSFTVRLTSKFTFNTAWTLIKSTDPQIPTLNSFMVGAKLPF